MKKTIVKKIVLVLSLLLTIPPAKAEVQDTIVKMVIIEKVVEKEKPKEKKVWEWVGKVAERVTAALIVIILAK